MNTTPLHPALVHLPLGVAAVMPLLAAGLAWAVWTDRLPVRAWLITIGFQGLLLGGAFVAMRTGEGDEDRVEDLVGHAALHLHESMAEQFVWAVGITLALALLVPFVKRNAALPLMAATIAGTLVVVGAGVRVGHAGGELIYVHGAASAYASGARGSTDARAASEPPAASQALASTGRAGSGVGTDRGR